jgi:two-component system response regulator AtoC
MDRKILIVEDDAAVRRALAETLAEAGYDVSVAEDAETGLSRLAQVEPDVVLTDVRMPGMDGVELLRLLKERAPGIDVILMTAFNDMPTVVRAMREGAFEFLVKPLKAAELRTVLTRLFEDRRSRVAAEPPAEEVSSPELDVLVGHHPSMLQVYKRVGQAASGRVSVLIRGETGTGKERVAWAIHAHSATRDEPFVAVNCTAIPHDLLESELFGHVRGAFTGAVADRRGRFALAGRGTIFLDEIGDMSPPLQAKLLRVLEERRYFPVGSEGAETTEARLLAATHRDLEAMVQDGRFREDLYYRLRVVEIRLPSLRDRISDLPLLAHHFVRRASLELGQGEPALPDETLAALLTHSWPGNVRELENCLTRAVVLATGGVIRSEHLGMGTDAVAPSNAFPTLAELEREHVQRALALTGGNRTRAAEVLGVSKPKLYRLLDKHGLASS